jgi:exopolyphosphatase / guanosine-5'-triphosphate,3'-diphosphate pyrophosphatase
MPKVAHPYFAAVDLGSNSFHLLIMRLHQGVLEVVDREKDMVQLALGLTPQGGLTPTAQKRALTCLKRFGERLANIPPEQIRVVGTKTLRAAERAKGFMKHAEETLGHTIEIISGFEEARLVYNGLAHSVANDNYNRLVIDIGGGSTELIIGRDATPHILESLNIGCVTASQILGKEKITKKSYQRAYLAAQAQIEQVRPTYLKAGWDIVYGTSGTMKAIAEVLASTQGNAIIYKDALCALAQQLVKDGRIHYPKLGAARQSVLPGGIAVLHALFDELAIDKIHIADATLKEGLIYDLVGRFDNEDARPLSVERLQKQYYVDTAQANRVAQCALALWRQLKTPTIPAVSRTKLLTWAALLHEVGLAISHSGHHNHGHYILENSDLAGFGRYEQNLLAAMVRGQRKKILSSGLDPIEPQTLTALLPLLVCLRLAVLLHRRREDLPFVPKISQRGGQRFYLRFPSQWLKQHPLTTASLSIEAETLAVAGLHLGFH